MTKHNKITKITIIQTKIKVKTENVQIKTNLKY